MWQRDLEFTGDPRVDPFLGCLGGVPQSRAVLGPFRVSRLRNDNLAMLDAMPPGEIMREAIALVGQAFAGAIGGRCHGAASRRAADWLHAEVVDSQSQPPIRFADAMPLYPRLSCGATRKCALKHPFASLRTFRCSRCGDNLDSMARSARDTG